MLQLKRKPIGRGKLRACFAHPDDPRMAVKVSKGRKGKYLQREIGFYRRLKNQGVGPGRHIPKYYGHCETNYGAAIVVDLVRNYDGEISRPLHWYLSQGMAVGNFDACFEELIESFLLKLIMVKPGMELGNLLVQKISATSAHLVAIHGLGDTVTRNRLNLLPPLARRKIRRRWKDIVARFYQSQEIHL